MSLLDEMRGAGVEPNVISFNATISACEKGGQWERAVSLLDEMRGAGVEPDVISFNAAIQACATAGQPSAALTLFVAAKRRVAPSRVTINAVLDAICSFDPVEAGALWRSSVEQGLYPAVEKVEGGVPKLDLHEHSEGAAETAVRWWLEERVQRTSELIIVTGYGKSRKETGTGDVRARVVRVLGEVGVPATIADDNPGRVLVGKNIPSR